MILHCIDPGSGKCSTGYVKLSDRGEVGFARVMDNSQVRSKVKEIPDGDMLVVEMPRTMGMPANDHVFETAYHAGRIVEAFGRDDRVVRIYRPDVKKAICGQMAARDSNIRAAIIDRYGGKRQAIGAVKCQACKGRGWRGRGRPQCDVCRGGRWEVPPGPLHAVVDHCWAALALGLTCLAQLETSA